jgi:histidinol-phosphate/aromatic aminotransferase/cobyric acid decarboxylase-like protein
MHDEMMSFINEQKVRILASRSVTGTDHRPKNWIEPSHLSYNNGPAGSWLLRDAMAMHINETFHPAFEVTNQHITFGPGVTALNEMLVKNLADEREAWLLGMPCYGQFNVDLKMTTG